MPETDTAKPSFSSARRWLGLLNTVLAVAGGLALLVMANYLAAGYFRDFQWSRDAAFKLSQPDPGRAGKPDQRCECDHLLRSPRGK